MGKHLVLVGGGHAHLTTLLHLSDFVGKGHQVTLVSRSAYHYYSGMGPGVLGGTYRPEQIRFHIQKMAQDRGASFVLGSVVHVDVAARTLLLASGEKVRYDVVSFNVGSYVPIESLGDAGPRVFTAKPIENLLRARSLIISLLRQGSPRLAVIGGGPAALELAGNLWRLVSSQGGKAQIRVLGGKKFLGRLPEKVRRMALASLSSRQVEVVEGSYVTRVEEDTARLSDGRTVSFDCAVAALGVKPTQLFQTSELPTDEEGGLSVNQFLQSVMYPEIFGGGDCINFTPRRLDKVGVYAVRENPVLHHNVLAALEGGSLIPFVPQRSYLLIFNLGNGKGIFFRNRTVWQGRLAFRLKSFIDTRFMKRFQVSGELREPISAAALPGRQ